MANPPLTSPQLTAIHTHYQGQLAKIVEAMNLRKWLVEKTIERLGMANASGDEILGLLGQLHAFITSPTSTLTPPESQP